MAGQSYKAVRDVVVAGNAYPEGKTFDAQPEAVRVALARGWVEQAKPKPKQTKRNAKGSSKQ
jgi:hypothetical protein